MSQQPELTVVKELSFKPYGRPLGDILADLYGKKILILSVAQCPAGSTTVAYPQR